MIKSGLASLSMLAAVLLLLFACTGSHLHTGVEHEAQGTNRTTASSGAEDETVTLKVLIIEQSVKWNEYPDHAVAKAIEEKLGVRIEFVTVDEAGFNLLLVSGDMPDIVRTEPAKYGKQLIEGGLIIPMDPMLKKFGPDITANIPSVVEYSRNTWSAGRGQLYFLPPQVQPEASPEYSPLTIGPTIRWDYYKEVGAPAFRSPDELLDVLELIVKRHPETPEGLPVYGVSMWQDWGLWPYIIPFSWYTMQSYGNSELMVRTLGEPHFENILTEEDSTYWVATDFYYKARRRGLLDPDALTMKQTDYLAKASAGQLTIGPAIWAMGDFNSKHAKEAKGYIVLPAGKRAWSGGATPYGWSGKSYAITRSSKHPEAAMRLLNYLYSYEGVRTLYSGIEGEHWEVVDGEPKIKANTFELKHEGGKAWSMTGIAMDLNLIGLGGSVLDPDSGAPLDLFQTREAMVLSASELEKDFSRYYGGRHPGDVLRKYIEEGKLVDSNTVWDLSAKENLAQPVGSEAEAVLVEEGSAEIPASMLKIEAQLMELASGYAIKLIHAKDDDEFGRLKREALQAFKEAGAEAFTSFYTGTGSQAE
ncbi:extracellular solute-binding protein [Cohnella hongkongensis]|uniref:Extracellular solute-binding protein n=1 Tax=Cohnella hongkongensis TaxID=178337 RepID=A0ABV9FIA6_9BACL